MNEEDITKKLYKLYDKFRKDNNLSKIKMNSLRWDDVKKNNIQFLKKFHEFRKLFVDTLLEECVKSLKCKKCIMNILYIHI